MPFHFILVIYKVYDATKIIPSIKLIKKSKAGVKLEQAEQVALLLCAILISKYGIEIEEFLNKTDSYIL